jgi:predicted DsbA family dithiol-disulfide isomerase
LFAKLMMNLDYWISKLCPTCSILDRKLEQSQENQKL